MKPRILYSSRNGVWVCFLPKPYAPTNRVGYGSTPLKAYINWARYT